MASNHRFLPLTGLLVLLGAPAPAQHLWWNLQGQRDATCLYGEITVLATHPAIADEPIPAKVITALKSLPRAAKAKEGSNQ